MRSFFKHKAISASVAVLATALMFNVGCSATSTIVTTLDAVVASAEAAIPFIPQIPAPLKPVIESYLSSVSGAASQTITELGTKDSGTLKASLIDGYWAAVALDPNTLGQLPPIAQSIILAVQASVRAFLAAIVPVHTAAVAHAVNSGAITFSLHDRAQLRSIQRRADAVSKKLGK